LRDSDSFFQNEGESDRERFRTELPGTRNRFLLSALGRRYGGGQIMDFTRGALLWLLGLPLPVILLIALFWHH
jgi:hypothetical protein